MYKDHAINEEAGSRIHDATGVYKDNSTNEEVGSRIHDATGVYRPCEE